MRYEGILDKPAGARGQAVTCHRFPIMDLGVVSWQDMKEILDSIDEAITTQWSAGPSASLVG